VTDNPFLDFNDPYSQRSNARNEREERIAVKKPRQPMVLQGLEKKQAETAKQLIRYREWKAQVREGMSRGDYGKEIIELFRYLRKPTVAAGLLEYIANAKWLHACSEDTKITVLGWIDHAIVRHNIRDGRSPMDDPMPGLDGITPDQPPTDGFVEIRQMLLGELI
jgi:hypothetical protein